VIYGARISVVVGLAASALAGIINVVVGMVSGYLRGKFDLLLQRLVDTVQCLPSLPLMMVVVSLIGPGQLTIILVLGVLWGIKGSRIIRSSVISIRENVYVAAAVASGCSTARILTRHVIPHIMPSIIILFTIHLPATILAEASLSFLGFGIPPPAPSWGGMLSGMGRKYMFLAPWMVIWPGLTLTIVVYGVNMFGDAVRDILDPKLRGGGGRYGVRVF
jgi:peptide/nickel transport system permease protein